MAEAVAVGVPAAAAVAALLVGLLVVLQAHVPLRMVMVLVVMIMFFFFFAFVAADDAGQRNLLVVEFASKWCFNRQTDSWCCAFAVNLGLQTGAVVLVGSSSSSFPAFSRNPWIDSCFRLFCHWPKLAGPWPITEWVGLAANYMGSPVQLFLCVV